MAKRLNVSLKKKHHPITTCSSNFTQTKTRPPPKIKATTNPSNYKNENGEGLKAVPQNKDVAILKTF